jgi:hypothetical protein
MIDPNKSPILCLLRDSYHGFQMLGDFNPAKPNLLIYASCHGRTLLDYFRHRPDAVAQFNLMRLETGPLLVLSRERDVFSDPGIKSVFCSADVLVTYNMGARHGVLSLDRVSKLCRPGVKVITFTAPNFSCLWPVALGYGGGLGVLNRLDKGLTVQQIQKSFLERTFDPLFHLRWRLELGRYADKDRYHDIGLSAFVQQNIQKAPLFIAHSHPSFITMSYVGSEVLGRLGFNKESLDMILAKPPDIGTMNAQPRTNYELKHFGFKYPYPISSGGDEHYLGLISDYAKVWAQGGFIFPSMD